MVEDVNRFADEERAPDEADRNACLGNSMGPGETITWSLECRGSAETGRGIGNHPVLRTHSMSDIVQKALGVLPHPAPRRYRLRRVYRADHLPALPQDGRRTRHRAPEKVRLAHAPRYWRHRPHRHLHRHPSHVRQADRHPPRHLRGSPVPLQQARIRAEREQPATETNHKKPAKRGRR